MGHGAREDKTLRIDRTRGSWMLVEGLLTSVALTGMAYWFERRGSPESGIQMLSMVFVIAILRPWLPQRRT